MFAIQRITDPATCDEPIIPEKPTKSSAGQRFLLSVVRMLVVVLILALILSVILIVIHSQVRPSCTSRKRKGDGNNND
jgi:hypothetical protein